MPATPPAPPIDGLLPTAAQQKVLARSPAQCFLHGLVQSLPFLIVLLPFGVLFGVVAGEAGMDLPKVIGFSVLVLAGASQFTAVQLLSDNAPALVIIASALVVNLRMAMYSAALVPWIGKSSGGSRAAVAYLLVDQTYALAVQHYEENPRLRLDQRLGYFFGAALACCAPWVVASVLGFTLGRSIPESWALDFAVPITFLAMIAPMLRSPAHIAAALVSIIMSLVLASLPAGLGMLIAAAMAMAAGASVEVWQDRRRKGATA